MHGNTTLQCIIFGVCMAELWVYVRGNGGVTSAAFIVTKCIDVNVMS